MGYPVFASGDVLLATDMNAVGLWLVKTQTISASPQAVTDCFSASYDNYIITVSGGTASTSGNIEMSFSGVTNGMYEGRAGVSIPAGAFVGNVTDNGAKFLTGTYSTTGKFMYTILLNPFLSTQTRHITPGFLASTSEVTSSTGFINNTSSFTGFTLTASSGTWTGGTIRVYGLRN